MSEVHEKKILRLIEAYKKACAEVEKFSPGRMKPIPASKLEQAKQQVVNSFVTPLLVRIISEITSKGNWTEVQEISEWVGRMVNEEATSRGFLDQFPPMYELNLLTGVIEAHHEDKIEPDETELEEHEEVEPLTLDPPKIEWVPPPFGDVKVETDKAGRTIGTDAPEDTDGK